MFHMKQLFSPQLFQRLQQGVQIVGAVVFQLHPAFLLSVDDPAGAPQLFAQLPGGLLNIIDGKDILLGAFLFSLL